MAACVFTPKAEADLDGIWFDIAQRSSTTVADRTLDRIRDRCQERAEFPLLGERVDHLLPNLRRLIVGVYLVFYFPTGNGISVMRVAHGKRDIDRLFD